MRTAQSSRNVARFIMTKAQSLRFDQFTYSEQPIPLPLAVKDSFDITSIWSKAIRSN